MSSFFRAVLVTILMPFLFASPASAIANEFSVGNTNEPSVPSVPSLPSSMRNNAQEAETRVLESDITSQSAVANYCSAGGTAEVCGVMSDASPEGASIGNDIVAPFPHTRPENLGARPTVARPQAPKPAANKPPTQDSQVSAAEEQLSQQCKSLAAQAKSACDSAMASVDESRKEFEQMTNSIKRQASANPASACGQMGKTATNTSNEMQGARNSCHQAVSSCDRTCGDAVNKLNSLPQSAAYVRSTQGDTLCQTAGLRLANIDMNLKQVQTAAYQSNKCYSDATGSSFNPNSATGMSADQIQKRPTASADCSNPQVAATSPICICRMNPSSSACGMGGGAAMPVARKTGTESSFTDLTSTAAGFVDSSTDGEVGFHEKTPTGQWAQKNGGGSAGVGSGAGNASGSANAKKRSGGLPSRYETTVNSGVYGGQIQSIGKASGGISVNDPRYKAWQAANARAKAAGKPGIDLRRFLPSARVPASVGAGRNGIGSPHSNIFSTIRNRYARQANSLDP